MGISRYENNLVVRTSTIEYSDILDRRGVSFIDHVSFEKFKTLRVRDIIGIEVINHTWQPSDRFFKLASQYYNDPTYWWIIAYYNNLPLETDAKVGQVLEIPVPLEYILSALGY
tara:strand:- start:29 stop:370 length:342 start_codon:yes stop_codon:yes gene_type:complete